MDLLAVEVDEVFDCCNRSDVSSILGAEVADVLFAAQKYSPHLVFSAAYSSGLVSRNISICCC